MKKTILPLSVLILCTVFFIFYTAIAYYNRFHSDDLNLAGDIALKGMGPTIRDWFMNWEFNLTTVFLIGLLYLFNDINLVFLNSTIFVFNVLSLYLLIREIFDRFLSVRNRSIAALCALMIITMLYFANRAEGDVVYWVTGQIAYSLPLCYLSLGLYFWLKNTNSGIFLACIFMFMFAHSRFNYDASFMAIYFVVAFAAWKYKMPFGWKTHLPFIFFIIGLITYLMIPGVSKRLSFHTEGPRQETLAAGNFLNYYFIAIRHFAIMFFQNIPQMLFAVFCVATGNIYADFFKTLFNRYKLLSMYATIAFLGALLAHTTIMIIALRTPIGYGRVFFMLDFLWIITMVIVLTHLGSKIKIHQAVSNLFAFTPILLILLLITVNSTRNFLLARTFTGKYDHRIETMRALNKSGYTGKMYFDRLPSSGILRIDDLEKENTVTRFTPYNNYATRKYYNLGYEIYLKP